MVRYWFFIVISVVLLLLFPGEKVVAQLPYTYVDSIPVRENGRVLSSAWCGGIHSPQFSSLHLDPDNFEDLMVFDQSGLRVLLFQNLGHADSVAYAFDRTHRPAFPYRQELFMLLADYNCDGKKDLFEYLNGTIRVYQNTGTPQTGPQFTLVSDPLLSIEGALNLPMLTRPTSLPAITDLDGDGDLDILVLSKDSQASRIHMHRNLSQENYGHCDSLVYTLADFCWGKYDDQSLASNPELGISCRVGQHGHAGYQIESGERVRGENGGGQIEFEEGVRGSERIQHPSGTTLTALDLDGDGDKEVLHANFPSPNTFMLRNGGDATSAFMDSVEVFFPEADSSIFIEIYPASFFEDVNNDGARDLLVAPFVAFNDQDNLDQSWFFRNDGSDADPELHLDSKNFLLSDMIDVGAKSHPELLDIEGDGDLDLLVGNFAKDDTFATVHFYRNTGSASQAAFALESTDYMGLSQWGYKDLALASGDLDRDGDLDLVLGNQDGEVAYILNQPQPNGEANFPGAPTLFAGVQVPANAAPFLYDLNGDQELDLFVGKLDGKISYFENQGSNGAFQFTAATENDFWGEVDVDPDCCVGNSAPRIINHLGSPHLLVARDIGQIVSYNNLSVSQPAQMLDSLVVDGFFLTLAAGDLDGDGDAELVVGNQAGGLEVIDFDVLVASPGGVEATWPEWRLWPNPSSGEVTLEFAGLRSGRVTWTNLTGQLLGEQMVQPGQNVVDLKALPAGVYLLRLDVAGKSSWKKLILR